MLSSSIPVVGELFQWLLDSIGWVLAKIYDFVPNYGVSIIILTIIIRFVLFPLGVKQIKSMQHMQAIQPKIKDIQKKYKGNKQKAQEETMKLYKEAGVNPLGGCLPVLAQFPILIAMYAVIRAPGLLGLDAAGEPAAEGQPAAAYEVTNNHLPVNSQLFADTIQHEHTSLIIVNLQCSAAQAGSQAPINDSQGNQVAPGKTLVTSENQPIVGVDGQTFVSKPALDCGDSSTDKIAYIGMLLFMVGTTFFQQRQMQKASPPNAASSQQQAIMKVMPLFFGFIGFTFPAGLVLVLDHVQPVPDRSADPPAPRRSHRPGRPGEAHGRAEGTAGQPWRRAGQEGHLRLHAGAGRERAESARGHGRQGQRVERHRSQRIGHSRVEPARNRQGWVHEGWHHEGWHHEGWVHEGWRTP